MGYELHITRAESWVDSQEDPITADEWLAYVAKDEELTFFAENGPYFAVWNGTGASAQSWLDWSDGQLYTKNPGRRELIKMLQIARYFSAKVRGDEDEIYSRIEDHPEEAERERTRGWWRFW